MTKHEARELVAKYGSMTAAAERVGCSRGKIKRALAQPDEGENKRCVLDAPSGVATFSAKSGNFQRIHVPIWRGESLAGAMIQRFKA